MIREHKIGRLAVLMTGMILVAMTCVAYADEKGVTGTWKKATILQSGEEVVWTWKFKQEGEKLTGTLNFSKGASIDIKDGKIERDNIFFTVEREVGGRSFKANYSGKVDGDTIRGKAVNQRPNGSKTETDWEVTRKSD